MECPKNLEQVIFLRLWPKTMSWKLQNCHNIYIVPKFHPTQVTHQTQITIAQVTYSCTQERSKSTKAHSSYMSCQTHTSSIIGSTCSCQHYSFCQHYRQNTKAHTSSQLPTSTQQLQPRRWPTKGILLHSHIHTQDKCSFLCLPCSCQPSPWPCSDFPLSFQFFPQAQEHLLSKLLQWLGELTVGIHYQQETPHTLPRTNT